MSEDWRPGEFDVLKFRMREYARLSIWMVVWLSANFVSAADQSPKTINPAAMPLWEALALGFIEGMTEYLPVSSTGHLLIFQHWVGRGTSADETEAADALAICIQSGAILAVVLLYFRRLQQMVRGILGGDVDGRRLFFHLIIAFLPAAVFGLLFQRTIKAHLFGIRPVTVAIFTGAVLILATPRLHRSEGQSVEKDLTQLKWPEALLIGCLQCLAFWPGFSRSLATIFACRVVKLRMADAVEFSFLLGLVTLTAATAKEGLSHGSKIIEHYGVMSPLLSLIVAFVSAVISVKFMVEVLGRYGLTPFGYYRLLLALLCLRLWN